VRWPPDSMARNLSVPKQVCAAATGAAEFVALTSSVPRMTRGLRRCVLRFAASAAEKFDHGAIEGGDIVWFAAGDGGSEITLLLPTWRFLLRDYMGVRIVCGCSFQGRVRSPDP
jgi:hypothetical protein